MNPIQGSVRGEAILDGDASEGIDVKLYAVTSGWAVVTGVPVSTGSDNPTRILAVGASPFIQAMTGSTILFAENGSRVITEVFSSRVIYIDSPLLVDPDTVLDDTISMAAQGGLREIELDANDELRITDVFLSQEKDSEYALVEGEDSPGRRVAKGRLLKVGSINLQYKTPHICQRQCALKYFGHEDGLNVCIIRGNIT